MKPVQDFTLNQSENELQLGVVISSDFCAEECETEGEQFHLGKGRSFFLKETPVDSLVPQYVNTALHSCQVKSFFSDAAFLSFSKWFQTSAKKKKLRKQCKSCLYCHQMVALEVASNRKKASLFRLLYQTICCQINLPYIYYIIPTRMCGSPRACTFQY